MKNSTFLPGLDLVRLWGILTVVVYHYQVETLSAGIGPSWFWQGTALLVQAAVYGMTLLSGVCLSWQEKARSWSLKRYLAGRFRAIYPLYWACFLPIFLYSDLIRGNNGDVARWKIFLSLAGIDGLAQSFTPTFYKLGEWYLGCILCLYALFPLFWQMVLRYGARSAAVAGLGIWLAWGLLPDPEGLYSTLWGQLPLFLVGMVLGSALPSLARWGVGAGCAALIIGLAHLPGYWAVTAASVALFVLLFQLGQRLILPDTFLSKAVHWLSRRCFGVFLLHHLAITLVLIPALQNWGSTTLHWALGLLVLVAGSFVLSLLIERISRWIWLRLVPGKGASPLP